MNMIVRVFVLFWAKKLMEDLCASTWYSFSYFPKLIYAVVEGSALPLLALIPLSRKSLVSSHYPT